MTLREKLEADYITAVKAKDTTKVSTLRMLRSEMKNVEIAKQKTLEEQDVLDVIGREVKKLKDSVDSFTAGGRNDLAEPAAAEMKMLEEYLPAKLSDDELKAIVEAAVVATGATAPSDMGKVMAEVMKSAKGRADGGQVNAMVKAALIK